MPRTRRGGMARAILGTEYKAPIKILVYEECENEESSNSNRKSS